VASSSREHALKVSENKVPKIILGPYNMQREWKALEFLNLRAREKHCNSKEARRRNREHN
jgi:hypothetical protein